MALHSEVCTTIAKDTYLMPFNVVSPVKKRDKHFIRRYDDFTEPLLSSSFRNFTNIMISDRKTLTIRSPEMTNHR